MVSRIAAIVLIIILILFFLSVFGPMHSQKKFWITIQKIRSIMDTGSYWIFNFCAILVILSAVLRGVGRLLG